MTKRFQTAPGVHISDIEIDSDLLPLCQRP